VSDDVAKLFQLIGELSKLVKAAGARTEERPIAPGTQHTVINININRVNVSLESLYNHLVGSELSPNFGDGRGQAAAA
jgi:hypothetical protein